MIDQDDALTLEEFCRGRDVSPEEVIHRLISDYLEDLENVYPVDEDDEGIRADLRYERLCDERLGI